METRMFLSILSVIVYSSHAESVKRCCFPNQISGTWQVIVGHHTVDEYEHYADYKKMKVLHIGKEENHLYDLDKQTMYLFTHAGCSKQKIIINIQQCVGERAEFESRFQARALKRKGWRWVNKWKSYDIAHPDKADKADPSKKTVHNLYVDEVTCFIEKTVTEYPDGTSETFQLTDIKPVVEEPTIFDLDTSECVGEVGVDKIKTEL